jgi:hypothetical protein
MIVQRIDFKSIFHKKLFVVKKIVATCSEQKDHVIPGTPGPTARKPTTLFNFQPDQKTSKNYFPLPHRTAPKDRTAVKDRTTRTRYDYFIFPFYSFRSLQPQTAPQEKPKNHSRTTAPHHRTRPPQTHPLCTAALYMGKFILLRQRKSILRKLIIE